MMRFWTALIGLYAMTSQATAQEQMCTDDRGAERCHASAIAEQDRLFGLQPIATLAEQGTSVRRAVFVDGYGRDLLAISFLRPRGGDMLVEIRAPGRNGQSPATASIALAPTLWQEIGAQGRHFDRLLAPRPTASDNDDIEICLHSWIVRVEVHDPAQLATNVAAELMVPASTRTAVEDACGDGLAVTYAFALADHAMRAMPVCQLVSELRQRNAVTRLADCLLLSGDRAAAARAMNRATEIGNLRSPFGPEPNLSLLFAEDSRMVVEGQIRAQDWQGSDFRAWLSQFRAATLSFASFNGLSPDIVESHGVLQIRRDEDGPNEIASFRLRWTQQLGRAVIAELIIDAFRPMAEAHEE